MTCDRGSIAAFAAAMTVLVVAGVGFSAALSAYKIHLTKKEIYAEGGRALRDVPSETESWKQMGPDRIYPSEYLETLGTSNYLTRAYARKASEPGSRSETIGLHLAYYTGMINTVPHVAERCMVGAGLELVRSGIIVPLALDRSSCRADEDVPEHRAGQVYRTVVRRDGVRLREVRLPYRPEGMALRVSEFRDKSGNRTYAGYFFVANGGWVSSAEGVRLLAFDLRNDYAYYLKVQFDSSEAKSPEDLAARASSLLNELLGEIMLCVPDWVRVERGEYPPRDRDGAGRNAPAGAGQE